MVLLNLLTNSLKFTSEGTITIDASCQTVLDGAKYLRIGITDTGIGIP
jgi:signal transduction histidine kinase